METRVLVEDRKSSFNPENAEEESAEQTALDNWIQIRGERSGKWWFSAVHNVTAMVGAGVLGFPYAMSELGWGPGVTVLVVSWMITLYTLWEMVEMHEMVPGQRFDRYHELGQRAFGNKLGLWIVVPQQLVVQVGVDIVYMITAGKSLKKFHDLVRGDHHTHTNTTLYILIFASIHFALSQLPDFNSILGVSLAAALMSFSYSTIAWGATVGKRPESGVEYGYKAKSEGGTVFSFFRALGNIAFAYAGHNVVMEIQSTMPSTPHTPSNKPMWKGVIAAYIIVAFCYFPVAILGFWRFGNAVDEDILVQLDNPRWLIAMANMFLVVHLIGSYQLYAMPVFDMIEMVLVKKLRLKLTWYLRFLARNTYVAFTTIIAITTFPFFGGLLGFFGGFAFAPTTYFLPCIIWLILKKPRKFSRSWFINWICVVVGVVLMMAAGIGGLRVIIVKARCYKLFYSGNTSSSCLDT